MRLCSSAPATALLSANIIWSWPEEANVVLGVKATLTKEQSRSGRTSRHGTRLTFTQQRAALEVSKCPGNGIFFWGGGVWKQQSWSHDRYQSLLQNKSPNNHADARRGNFRRFPTWPRQSCYYSNLQFDFFSHEASVPQQPGPQLHPDDAEDEEDKEAQCQHVAQHWKRV